MKIAISGKGGVGKSTIAAALSLLLAKQGQKVLAIDADPDANLAAALGIPLKIQQKIIPIAEQAALIEERTGAKVKQYGQIFKLNPTVSDIAEKFATLHNNIALLVLGAIEKGGSGCACPESVLLKALITDLVLFKEETLIMDMEAGIEHLGRATARGVDLMLIVVEPGQRSIDTAKRIMVMSQEIGIKNIKWIGNKITNQNDQSFIRSSFPKTATLGFIPFSESIRTADRQGHSAIDGIQSDLADCFANILKLVCMKVPGS